MENLCSSANSRLQIYWMPRSLKSLSKWYKTLENIQTKVFIFTLHLFVGITLLMTIIEIIYFITFSFILIIIFIKESRIFSVKVSGFEGLCAGFIYLYLLDA